RCTCGCRADRILEETPMNPDFPSLPTAPLLELGCLTLPLHVSLLENRISAYDYQHPVLCVTGRSPACRSADSAPSTELRYVERAERSDEDPNSARSDPVRKPGADITLVR